MHGGSMQSCPAMHSCPPWETTHPKFVPPFKCMKMGRKHAPWVVYHVFSMSFHLFFVFRKGGQLYMGVPCTGVRPCMAVPHKKLHIGSLLHHPNGSLCTDCVPQGLLTLWVAYVNAYLLSFNKGDSHAWGFHAKLSGHAKLSPMRNHTSQVCPAFQMHVEG